MSQTQDCDSKKAKDKDADIATDIKGKVTFMSKIAEQLTKKNHMRGLK
jgi:hypothetical protein